ncbi:hypothetical protein GYMLUDRAFT_245461 [Collybiopsis luxurians FD-317 M1]|uniref:Uncharacterized protein n=1 Tax=Collybiopsis luxurians FD-317 M1 TaxID=944289 RepID=A0A0D0BV51_9AGAR|nr:hypothetical protein GYMLUDRAFT_245461 [Collybiopsis luxurians FD-317 M1]
MPVLIVYCVGVPLFISPRVYDWTTPTIKVSEIRAKLAVESGLSQQVVLSNITSDADILEKFKEEFVQADDILLATQFSTPLSALSVGAPVSESSAFQNSTLPTPNLKRTSKPKAKSLRPESFSTPMSPLLPLLIPMLRLPRTQRAVTRAQNKRTLTLDAVAVPSTKEPSGTSRASIRHGGNGTVDDSRCTMDPSAGRFFSETSTKRSVAKTSSRRMVFFMLGNFTDLSFALRIIQSTSLLYQTCPTIDIDWFRSDVVGRFECSDQKVTVVLNKILPHPLDPQVIAQLQQRAEPLFVLKRL